ncbi:TolB family protein [Nocardioides jishulii]|uniref:Bacterial Ig-like domain-containing protein n=1 Tax=Nocardioides jishulii TaxID=2575440 RepID=A0A4U2YSF9_9ACTN|nr:Ig-like domain repeat protein [Nocardioides jishulii]QCX28716.1 hypothetical protein FCL41_15135 [Nocardioides jishulii]TKI64388.1 hypothetical protein FC770_04435 [Nocardioides jishulii]
MTGRRVRRLSVLGVGALLAAPLAAVAPATVAPAHADTGPVPVTPPDGVTQGGSPSGQDLSADGRWIAWTGTTTSAAGTTHRLYVVDRTTGVTTPLVAGDAPIGTLSISDDGQRIVYVLGEVGDSFEGEAQVRLLDRSTGSSSLVSATDGVAGNAASWDPEISGDGSAVAFTTRATNLAPGTGGPGGIGGPTSAVVVKELATGAVERISGTEVTAQSSAPSISAEGDRVAFQTNEALVDADTDQNADVVVRTRSTEALVLASRAPDSGGTAPSISADGSRVAFLVQEGGRPGMLVSGVFVTHLATGATVRASLDGDRLLRSPGVLPALSADGRFVLFSALPGVVTDPPSRAIEVYVRDLALGSTRLVSAGGQAGTSYAFGHAISGTGRHVLLSYLSYSEESSEQTLWSHDLGDPTPAPFPDPEPVVPINSQLPTGEIGSGTGPSYSLAVTPGVWVGADGLTPSYQWWRNGRPIAGATGTTYVVRPADFGQWIAVRETLTPAEGDPVWAVSAATKAVKPASSLTAKVARSRVKAGAPVVCRVQVSHAFGVRPQGKVAVRSGQRSRTVKVDADGRMTVRLKGLRVGRHTVRFSYAGTPHVKGAATVRVRVRVTRR